ncbi:PAS domain-containing protein [Streptomyces massasporeus]|uniref:PAS domain-containing protein n=1 Tax=Streptomyces massasporeus TaxID=67324 RepID=UPI0036F16865
MRHLIEGTAAAVVILDEQLRHLYVNPAWVRVSGVPAEALSGRTLAEVLPDVRYPDDVMPQVLADGEPREVTITGTTHVGLGR